MTAFTMARSTKAGRKARQPPVPASTSAAVDGRSTKAGRKARQPLRPGPMRTIRLRFAQRRPGERPGNRSARRRDHHPDRLRSTKAGRKARQPPPSRTRCRWTRPTLNEGRAKGPATATLHERNPRRQQRSTKAGRKARQPPRDLGFCPRRPGARSTKAGRKARQPQETLHRIGLEQPRSTKAGRKARQPRRSTNGTLDASNAQRRPGERPGNRISLNQPRSSERVAAQRRPGERPGNRLGPGPLQRTTGVALNEGRAKGPATAHRSTATLWRGLTAQRRPGERPGNRWTPASSATARRPNAQRRPGERPGNRRGCGVGDPRRIRPLNEGRAKGPATARSALWTVLPPTALNEGRAKGPATAFRAALDSPVPACAQRRPGERPGNRRAGHGDRLGAGLRSTKAGRKARQPRPIA